MKFHHTWEEVENAGRLYNVEFSIDYNVTPYRPARINCDPGDAYPAEGGDVVINEVKVLSVEPNEPLQEARSRGFYWADRFLKEITEDFKIELAEHAAADDAAMRERDE